MLSTPRPDAHRRRLGPSTACLLACLAVGCSRSTATPGPASNPTATSSPSTDQGVPDPSAPAIVKGKSDRDGVVAALKEQGIDVVRPQDIILRTIRYTGLKEPLEWFVEVEQKPPTRGQEAPLRISLPPEGREVGDGTLNLIVLPPTSTGREGTRLVLRSVPAGGAGGRLVSEEAPPPWFQWPTKLVREQSRLDGGPVNPKPGRTYKLLTYSPTHQAFTTDVTLKCRSPKP